MDYSVIYAAEDVSHKAEENTILFLHLGEETLHGSLFDKKAQKFTGIKSLKSDHPTDLVIQSRVLRQEFGSTTATETFLFIPGMKCMLVPEPLFEKDDAEIIFRNQYLLEPWEEVAYTFSPGLKSWLLFSIPTRLKTELEMIVPAKKILHSVNPFLEGTMSFHQLKQNTAFHINYTDSGIWIVVFENGGLKLFNTYKSATPEDSLYFIMFVAEQLGINPLENEFYISGNIKKGDPNHELLHKYIRNLNFMERPVNFTYSLPLSTVPEAYYYNVYCSPLCVL